MTIRRKSPPAPVAAAREKASGLYRRLLDRVLVAAAMAVVLACTLGVGPFQVDGPGSIDASRVALLHR